MIKISDDKIKFIKKNLQTERNLLHYILKNTGTVVLIMTPRYQIRRIFTVSQIYSVMQLKR